MNKEITAKEMFEKLGYEKHIYSNGIRYTNGNTEQNIEFENDGFINIYSSCYNRKQNIEVLTVEEIQAIYQQIKDLGWDWNE